MMSQKFVKNMKITDVAKFRRPMIITMSGLPGSGKTHFSRELSQQLKIYLLSNDYIRNYYYQNITEKGEEQRLRIEKQVQSINKRRLLKLLLTRTSFVYDRDFNSLQSFETISKYAKLMGYQLIKIRIKSNDCDNISRISKREINYNKIIEGVIGDNIEYSSSYDTETYYAIKHRKPQEINDEFFDYIINNDKTIEEFNEAESKIIEDIKIKAISKRNK